MRNSKRTLCSGHGRLPSALWLAATLAVTPVAWAAPPPEASMASEESTPATSEPAGDLSAAATAATEARIASPSAETLEDEGKAREALGDYKGAAESYEGWAAAAQTDAEKRRAGASLQRVRDASRGRDASEPASTHRAELDPRWAPPPPKKAGAAKPGKRAPASDTPPKPGERIVTKWYFWVTIVAIAASAGAVAGIAIKASRDERKDSLDALQRAPAGGFGGPAVIRF